MAQLTMIKKPEGSWSIEAVDSVQAAISFDWAVTFNLDAGTAIRIECPFILLNQTSIPIELDSQSNPESLASTQALVRRSFTKLEVSNSGEVHMNFEGGYEIAIGPSPKYEAWDLWYDNSVHLICLPGDRVAKWPLKISEIYSPQG